MRRSDGTAQGKIKFVIFHTAASHLHDEDAVLALSRDSISEAQRDTSVSSKPKCRHLLDSPPSIVNQSRRHLTTPNEQQLCVAVADVDAREQHNCCKPRPTTLVRDQTGRIRRGVAPGSARIVHSFGLHAHYSRVANRD